MNRLKFILFALLGASCVHLGSSNDISTDEVSSNRMQILDLNIDVQLLILDQLDLDSLLSLSEINKFYSILVRDVFRRKHAKKLFKIVDPYIEGKADPIENVEIIFIQRTILKLLRNFGHLIQRLSFVGVKEDSSINEIGAYINLYCSESLVKFDISMNREYSNHFFNRMLKPFKAIEEVSVEGWLGNFSSSPHQFSDLFPTVRRLSFNRVFVNDTGFMNEKYPHLEHIYVMSTTSNYSNRINEADIEKMFRKNPQIRSLQLTFYTRSFLKIINQLLPNLEYLMLEGYTERNSLYEEPIFFENVQKLIMITDMLGMPKNITFGHLTEFLTNSCPEQDFEWIKLVERSPYLEKLYVIRGHISKEQLDRLATVEMGVKDVFLTIRMDVDDETIINFVKNNGKINKIHFRRDLTAATSSNSFNSVANVLQDQFGHKWNIVKYPYDLFLEM